MLFIDALNNSATDLIRKRNLSSDEKTKVWRALAEIYPQVPVLMKSEMSKRRVGVADNAVMYSTIERIREMPSVREFALLRDAVNDAALRVLPSSDLGEPSFFLSEELIETFQNDNRTRDLVHEFIVACKAVKYSPEIENSLAGAFRELVNSFNEFQKEKASASLRQLLDDLARNRARDTSLAVR